MKSKGKDFDNEQYYIGLTSKDRADPDKVGLYQLFKKPGFVDIRDIG